MSYTTVAKHSGTIPLSSCALSIAVHFGDVWLTARFPAARCLSRAGPTAAAALGRVRATSPLCACAAGTRPERRSELAQLGGRALRPTPWTADILGRAHP
jgi:hypothetical protein